MQTLLALPDAVLVKGRYYNHNYVAIPMNALWAPIIQSLIPHAVTVEQLLTSLATTMTPTVDSLINRQLPLLTSSQPLAALAKAGVLQGVVVASKALPATSTNTASNQQAPAFAITVKVNQQLLELTSPLPLVRGDRIQLSVSPNNTVQIVSVEQAGGNKELNKGGNNQPAKPLSETLLRQPAPLRSQPGPANSLDPGNYGPTDRSTSNRLVVEQSLRQSLPLQQPAGKMLPLLQQLRSEAPAQWPKSLTNNLAVLLQQFPRAEQLQTTAGLQQALHNSGLFFEAKLSQQPATAENNALNKPAAANTSSAPINYDIKGLLQRLVGQVNKAAHGAGAAPPHSTTSGAASPLLPAASRPESSSPLAATYNPQSLPELLNALQPSSTTPANKQKGHADVVLRQLGQQLIASLARSQMNQLETLISRQASSPDQPAAVNSWTLETPILQGNHIDNLSLRIEQQQEDATAAGKQLSGKQWVVMLAFDLHQLGKMNVQLKIVEQTVSATVWTEQQHTHREALQHIQTLKKNLQKAGVTVKQIDCQLGLPVNSSQPLYTQLVDVHT